MTRPDAVDRPERVVRAVAAGRSRRAAARRFEVSVSLVIKLVPRWRQAGSLAPARDGGWKRAVLAAHAERGHELVRRAPDLTIAAARAVWRDRQADLSPERLEQHPVRRDRQWRRSCRIKLL